MPYDAGAIRASNRVSEVVGRYVKLIRSGNEFEGLCPFHGEKTASFTVSDEKGFYHCFAGETRVITANGTKPISQLAGTSQTVLTTGGIWVPAEFKSYGRQRLYGLELSRNGVRKTVFATSGHRWFVRGRKTTVVTTNLTNGSRLAAVITQKKFIQADPGGIEHGIVYGDGTIQKGRGLVNLFGEKTLLSDLFYRHRSISAFIAPDGTEALRVYGGVNFAAMKDLPSLECPAEYIKGFLAGLMATDGHVAKDGTIMINNASAENLSYIRDLFTAIGTTTYSVMQQARVGYGKDLSPICRIHILPDTVDADFFLKPSQRKRFVTSSKKFGRMRWAVNSVTKSDRIEEVFCAEVPGHHAFALEDNILTGNCFGCGAHGDVIRFVMDHLGSGFVEACEILGGDRAAPDAPRYTPPPVDTKTIYDDLIAGEQDIVPAPSVSLRVWNPKRGHWGTFIPSMVFDYRSPTGQLLGCVLRIDLADGGKETPVVRWAASVGPQGEPGWARWPFDKPRPLYGLEKLPADISDQVIVVEGEKTAEAARRLLDRPVVTWCSGPSGIKYTDWSPMAGRPVLLIPDADRKIAKTDREAAKAGVAAGEMLPYEFQVGPAAMNEVAAKLQAVGCQVRIVDVDIDLEKSDGWDLADAEAEGWGFDRTIAWLAPRARDWAHPVALPEEAPVVEYDGPGAETDVPPQISDDAPFRILGYNKGTYYYFPRGSQQIAELTPGSHTVNNLISLAPLEHWENAFPKPAKSREKFDMGAAVNALINRAHRIGPYDHTRIRGRGAWVDSGRSVIHTGRRAIVDGSDIRPEKIDSHFIYEVAPDLNMGMADPATTAEANRLVQICRRLTWAQSLSGDLLAGWCVVAPICGALEWRSHIWVTGLAQSGKSTVIKRIVKQVVGGFGLYMDGKTTEPGIRQMVGIDARPVIMDEFEGEDASALQRVQSILDLARASSSGAFVTKGSTSGKAITYAVRSSFCFASINVNAKHYADESRISRLVLLQNTAPDAREHYRQLSNDIREWLPDDFSSKMFARSVKYLPTLQKNIVNFKLAAAHLFNSARDADQIGTLLAGLYLCHSTKEITAEEAEMWMAGREWEDHTALGADKDDRRMFERLMTKTIRMVNGHAEELNLGDAIVAGHAAEPGNHWEKHLLQLGIKIDRDYFIVANKSSRIDKLMEGSPWANDWPSKLKSLTNERLTDTTYFGPGMRTRGIKLPMALLIEGKQGL